MVLVTGGARAGKSAFARMRAEAAGGAPRLFIATAHAGDDEMRARIARHQRERGPTWRTVEAALDPASAVRAAADARVVLIDCLTLWLSNLMLAGRDDEAIDAAAADLCATASAARCPLFVVTNEVGLGIVPEHPLARRFRDLAGLTNQRFAAAASELYLLVCGQPLRIK
ncbi:MAG TPA: bifunctional adenosylcobinamide kinase/adenosylcobinamide-phosphate guanylyltransferase [Polyangia bacterium]|nr:bifunctional adenosylcobinamide kinase/adenosylcobinamide-phosphate guanylyltransferase [Polyangia bacterium]